MTTRLDDPRTTTDPVVRGALILTLAITIIGVLALVRAAVGDRVDHLTVRVDNQAALAVRIDALDAAGGRVGLGEAKPGTLRTDLAAANWTVTVPATATTALERAGSELPVISQSRSGRPHRPRSRRRLPPGTGKRAAACLASPCGRRYPREQLDPGRTVQAGPPGRSLPRGRPPATARSTSARRSLPGPTPTTGCATRPPPSPAPVPAGPSPCGSGCA